MGEKLKKYDTVMGGFESGLVDKYSDDGQSVNADEAERVIGELEAEVEQLNALGQFFSDNGDHKQFADVVTENATLREQVGDLEADRKLLHRLIATMRRGEDETMEDTIEGIEGLRGEVACAEAKADRLAYAERGRDEAESRLAAVKEWEISVRNDVVAVDGFALDDLMDVLSPSFACPGCKEKDGRIKDLSDSLDVRKGNIAKFIELTARLERAREAWEKMREDYLIISGWPSPLANDMDVATCATTFDNQNAALATKEEADESNR